MYKEIFLEADEEVTSAIDKIRKAKTANVALILPRNALLGQSVVNLKLVYKEASNANRQVVIVSPDTVTRQLADRVGFVTLAKYDQKLLPPETSPKSTGAKTVKPVPAKAQRDEDDSDDNSASDENTDEDAKPTKPTAATAGFATKSVGGNDNKPADESEESSSDGDDDDSTEDTEPSRTSADRNGPAVKMYDRSTASGALPTRSNPQLRRSLDHRNQRRSLWRIFILAAIVLVVGAGTLIYLLPKATVNVTIATKPLAETLHTTIDTKATAIDTKTSTIPGVLISIDKSLKATTKATGQQDVGTKATGTVTIANGLDSNSHTLPAGTVLQSTNGKQYTLAADTVVPPASLAGGAVQAGTISAAVQASGPGDSYNTGPTHFTIPSLSSVAQQFITGTNATAISGGTSKMVTIVTADDIASATDNVTKQLQSGANDDLKAKAESQKLVFLPDAVKTIKTSTSADHQAGDQADSVEVTGTGTYSVIAFDEKLQQQLIASLLQDKIPAGQELVQSPNGQSSTKTQYQVDTLNDTSLNLITNLNAVIAPQFNQGIIRRALIGSPPSSASTIVDRQVQASDVTVAITPKHWHWLPFNPNNIILNFKFQTQS